MVQNTNDTYAATFYDIPGDRLARYEYELQAALSRAVQDATDKGWGGLSPEEEVAMEVTAWPIYRPENSLGPTLEVVGTYPTTAGPRQLSLLDKKPSRASEHFLATLKAFALEAYPQIKTSFTATTVIDGRLQHWRFDEAEFDEGRVATLRLDDGKPFELPPLPPNPGSIDGRI